MSDSLYKISIKGPGLTLNRDVPKPVADQLVVVLLTGSTIGAPLTPGTAGKSAPLRTPSNAQAVTPGSELVIREFLDSVNAKRVPDKITAIGAYLAQSGQGDFGKADLVANFEAAGEPVPKNLNRDLKWTLKAGWIAARTGKKETWYVTNTGQTAVREKFSPEVVKRTRGLMPGGTARKKEAKQ